MKRLTFSFIITLFCLGGAVQSASAQSQSASDISVTHKAAHYYKVLKNAGDDISKTPMSQNKMITLANGTDVQNVSTYTSDVYVNSTSVTLSFPFYGSHNGRYMRVYDYETDGHFDSNGPQFNTLKNNSINQKNGYVFGSAVPSSTGPYPGYYNSSNSLDVSFNSKPTKTYKIAVDCSQYSDFTTSTASTSWYSTIPVVTEEPTLVTRLLYTIHPASEMADKLKSCTGDTYLQEQTIKMPSVYLNPGSNDDRACVMLDLMPRNYFAYNSSNKVADPTVTATITSQPQDNVFTLYDYTKNKNANSVTLSDDQRYISFNYPSSNKVTDTSTPLVITVTTSVGSGKKTKTYNVARFKIYFVDDAEPRPWKDILSDATRHRSPVYLDSHYTKIDSLEFDYEKVNASNVFKDWPSTSFDSYEQEPDDNPYYPYPLPFEDMQFGFFPPRVQWGQYAIENRLRTYSDDSTITDKDFTDIRTLYSKYFSKHGTDAQKKRYVKDGSDNKTGNFLYIDATGAPSQIGALRFNQPLCTGTKLYMSAWVSAIHTGSGGNLMFSLVGYTDNGDGTETETVIDNFSTGVFYDQARSYSQTDVQGTIINQWSNPTIKTYASSEGMPEAIALWQQVFFTTTISKDYAGRFDRCAIKIYNHCKNSSGGDMMLDEIALYMEKPNPEVTQSTPICGKSSTVKISSKFDNILAIANATEAASANEGKEGGMWYCFLDKSKFDELEQGNVEGAFNAALLGDKNAQNSPTTEAFHFMKFNSHYESNPEFTNYTWDSADALTSSFAHRETDEDDEKWLVFNAMISDARLKPNHKYYLVVKAVDDASDTNYSYDKIDYTTFDMTNPKCRMIAEFTVQSAKRVKYEGDVDKTGDDISYCAGSTATLKVELLNRSTLTTTEEVVKDVYYDWWIGDLESYNDEKYGTSEKFSMATAIAAFRSWYPDCSSTEGATVQSESSDGSKSALSQEMIDAIAEASTTIDMKNGQKQAQLTLHKQSFDFYMVKNDDEATRYIVVDPIVNPKVDDDALYCWEPDVIEVHYAGAAPSAVDGFLSMADGYGDYKLNSAIRMGVKQIAKAKTGSSNYLFIPLREVALSDNATTLAKPINTDIRLTETDDPNTSVYVNEKEDGTAELNVLGTVVDAAYASATNGYSAYLKVQFNDNFKPVEGRYYKLKMAFGQNGDKANTCDGDIVVPIYIVPRYAVWVGNENNSTEWTNDNNWRRADLSEVDYDGDYYKNTEKYETNEANGTSKGFVPMSFTDVLLQTQKGENTVHPALYYVDNNKSENNLLKGYSTEGSNTLSEDATEYIQYNLEVEEYDGSSYSTLLSNHTISSGDYFCRPFYTYTCDSINFAPTAQLKGSRLMSYNAASVEYELNGSRWYTLASPLKGVVAGDMYLPTSGRQTTSYFRNINYDAATYTRTAPAVYQKGWDKATANVYYVTKDDNIYDNQNPTGSNKWNVSYVKADWSEEYNDVSVPYTTASPFSVMVYGEKMTSKPTDDKYLLRLPKADTSYSYYTMENVEGNKQDVSSSKADAGKLVTDDMTDGETAKDLTVTVTNGTESNDYFLVGNPFMTGLDMTAFFKQNTGLEQKYWIVNESKHIPAQWSEYSWKTTDETAVSTPGTVAPLQSFFVKRSQTGTSNELTVTFTDDMSTVIASSDAAVQKARGTRAGNATSSLTITADRDGLSSTALVMVSDHASNGFVDSEDAETIMDSNLGNMPTVYTTADGNAVSINTRASIDGVSLGVASADDTEVTLTFNGVENFDALYLYDAATKESTLLQSGAKFTVSGNTAGRYYLTRGAADPDGSDLASGYVVYALDKTIYVKGLQGGESVKVYDVAGRQLYTTAAASGDITVHVGQGVYIVKVNDTATKLAVR